MASPKKDMGFKWVSTLPETNIALEIKQVLIWILEHNGFVYVWKRYYGGRPPNALGKAES